MAIHRYNLWQPVYLVLCTAKTALSLLTHHYCFSCNKITALLLWWEPSNVGASFKATELLKNQMVMVKCQGDAKPKNSGCHWAEGCNCQWHSWRHLWWHMSWHQGLSKGIIFGISEGTSDSIIEGTPMEWRWLTWCVNQSWTDSGG